MKSEKVQTPRQGDLLFVVADRRLYSNRRIIEEKIGLRKDGIILEGEATGHHHRLENLNHAQVFRAPGDTTLVNVGPKGATVIHPEHGPVDLSKSTLYEVHRAREHDLHGNEHFVVD